MGAAQQTVAKDQIRKLVPFNGLSDAHFEEVIKKIIIKQLPSGKVLFKKGERDNQTCYVLSGEIDLLVGRSVKQKLLGDTEEAMHPLAPQQPRQFTAKSKTAVTILHIDSGLLDVMLTWDQSGEIEVNEIYTDSEINDDWMARMLQSELLLRLPALNIQQLIMRMEKVEVTAGTTIVNQNDDGDYYYIIKKGDCIVTRKPSSNSRAVKLAELHSGDSFGEESLLSGGKRNATITMVTEGEIMRLSKKDFDELLKEPLVNQIDYDLAREKASAGDRWLDVRLPGEYENSHLPDSINIPLAALRIEAESLDPEINYIVYCDTGRRSASASFLLGHLGINAFVLKNGIGNVPNEELVAEEKTASTQADDGSANIIDFNKQRLQSDQQPAVLQEVDDAKLGDREQALAEKEQHLQRAEAELVGKMAELETQAESEQAKRQQDQSKVNEGLKTELERLTQRINSKSDELTTAIAEKEELASNLARQEDIYAAQIIELENGHQGIEKESVHLRDELEMLRTERADSKERLASVENELDTVKQELDIARASGESTKSALQSEYQRLTEELENSRGNEQKLQDELAGYQQQKEELVRELEDIREKSVSEIGNSQQRFEELREQLKQAQDQQSSITSVQQQAETEHMSVLESVNQELHTLGEQANQLQHELNSLNDEKQNLVQQLDEATSRNAVVNSELERLRNDLGSANERRDTLQSELESLHTDKEQSLESKSSELSEIQTALQQARKELDSSKFGSQQETGRLRETISKLEQDKENLKQELDKTVQHSEAVLATVSAEKDLVIAQSAELQQRLANMESDLHAQLEKHDTHAHELRSGIENEKQSLDLARTEVLQLQARLSESESKHERELGNVRGQMEEVRTGLKTRLTDSKASHERQATRLQEDFEGASAELKTLESKFRAMRGERDSAIDLRAAVEQELETLRKRYDSMRNEVGTIQTGKKDTSEIERERDALNKDKHALETELASLRKQLESSGESDLKQLADKESKINHLRRDVERLADEKKYAEQERESALNEVKVQQATTDNTATNNEQMERKLAELQSARDTLENRYSELEQEYDELKQLFSQQDSKLKSADISMQDTKTQVERNEQQLATLENRRDEISVQLGAMQAQRDELQQQLIREQSGAQSANRTLQDQLSSLQTEYNNLQQRIHLNKKESDTHEQAMQAQELANQSLEQKFAEQERHTQALQLELSKLTIQSDDQIRQLQELDKELDAKQKQITSLLLNHNDAEELQQNAEMLTQNIESLEAVNSQTQTRLESLQAATAKEEARVAELESELFMARQQLEQQSAYKSDLEQFKRQQRHQPSAVTTVSSVSESNTVQSDIEKIYHQEQINTTARPQAIRPTEVGAAHPAADDVFGLTDLDETMFMGKPPRSRKLLFVLTLAIVAVVLGGTAYWWFVLQPGQQDKTLTKTSRPQIESDSGKRVSRQKPVSAAVIVSKSSAGKKKVKARKPETRKPETRKPTVEKNVANNEVRKDPQPLRKKPAAKIATDTTVKKDGLLKARRTYRDFLEDGGAGPVMVELPSGQFLMGSGANSPSFDERPQRQVKLPGYSISKYEVMFEDYDRFASATGRKKPDDNGWSRGRLPVINVAWDDAVAYTQWLSEQTGHTYRLPTEAEWEYAARAGTTTPYPWGLSKGKNNANCFNCGSKWDGRETALVGRFKPNSLGVYDMAGNVPEWVQDCYVNSYKKAPTDGTAVQTATCERRVVRGGSYRSSADNVRSAKREAFPADTRIDIGFRIVRVR